jgi:hypothetical protein
VNVPFIVELRESGWVHGAQMSRVLSRRAVVSTFCIVSSGDEHQLAYQRSCHTQHRHPALTNTYEVVVRPWRMICLPTDALEQVEAHNADYGHCHKHLALASGNP